MQFSRNIPTCIDKHWQSPETSERSSLHGLQKQLCNLMHHVYDDLRIMLPQLVTAAHNAESEEEDRPREGVWVR